ncbi:hypothetical protein QAD02_006271 [Eretmocerus hayati]|uniref:Uncharacterized protein n=1 Tax=Eretmocerus hayati TaxID=131215 RepID=A0ACC2N2T1_9HYME|nr:hypothetical protein QAD02_006271 [Eretmocerus hayati]
MKLETSQKLSNHLPSIPTKGLSPHHFHLPRYAVLTTGRVTAVVFTIWIIASGAVALRTYLGLGPNLCDLDPKPQRKRPFRIAIHSGGILSAAIIVGLPMLFTIFFYIKLLLRVRSNKRSSCKPPVTFCWDYELIRANMYSFIFFSILWMPLGIVFCMSAVKPVSPKVLVYLAWLAMSKSCFNNLLYCAADRHFRSCFMKLFDYCCCKTTVSFSRQRQRGGDGRSGSNDVRLRVHIMHSYASPASCRPAVTSGRTNGGRDVYEL